MDNKPANKKMGNKETSTPASANKKISRAFFVIPIIIILLFLKMGFDNVFGSHRLEGYVEGEFTYISSPVAGRLEGLDVQRGTTVSPGQILFSLEKTPMQSAYDEAHANYIKAHEGAEYDKLEFDRQQKLLLDKVSTTQEYQKAATQAQQSAQAQKQMEALVTHAKWELDQTTQTSPAQGIISDTLYRVGEWVPASSPVVTILTPQGVRVRTFVDEKRMAQISYGKKAKVIIDGQPHPFEGKIVYIAPAAEYTPPVIYSQESRSKFVWRVDIGFDDATAMKLHPGQPLEVEF